MSDELVLPGGEIHLWSSTVLQPTTVRQQLYQTLSLDERTRAAQFRFDLHRNAYIVSRGMLRSVLSRYVGIKAENLRFIYGINGKPALRDWTVYFNVSHSHDIVVIVLAREPKLGVDVEYIRSIPDLENVARQFLSPTECNELFALDPDKRYNGFFNCWTRKEAYVKAIGDGLYAPLDQLQVTFRPGDPAAIIKVPGNEPIASQWSLFDWRPSEQYAGAIAIYGTGWQLCEKFML